MVTILYCDKCGWYSKPNVGMRNKCPFCRQTIVEYPKDIYPRFLGKRKQIKDVTLLYVSGTQDEIDRFIEENLK